MKVMETNKTSVSVSFSDKDHPVWGVVKPVVLTGCVSCLLYFNASNFDGGEIKTIVYTALGSFGLEAFNLKRKS